MTLSASRVGYKHRATVRRDTGGVDAWGDPTGPSWTIHLPAEPCRAWTNTGAEPVSSERTVALEDRRISFSLETDITEADEVAAVFTLAGETIFSGPMTVEAILRHTDHLEVLVRKVG